MLEQLSQPLSLVMLAIIILLVIALVRAKRTNTEKEQAPSLQKSTSNISIPDGDSESDQRFMTKADEALRLTQTFQKFVPRQFVEHFEKHGSNTLDRSFP